MQVPPSLSGPCLGNAPALGPLLRLSCTLPSFHESRFLLQALADPLPRQECACPAFTSIPVRHGPKLQGSASAPAPALSSPPCGACTAPVCPTSQGPVLSCGRGESTWRAGPAPKSLASPAVFCLSHLGKIFLPSEPQPFICEMGTPTHFEALDKIKEIKHRSWHTVDASHSPPKCAY